MAVTLQDTIDKQQHGAIGHVLASQTFWVFLAAVLAFAYLSFATTSFDTP